MKETIFDYIIAGSGIAGNICAYELARRNKTCLILEKEPFRKEKVCGGGIPHTALRILRDIDISIEELFRKDVKVVKGDVFYQNGKFVEHNYSSDSYALGTSRYLFDEFLLQQAIRQGAAIRYNETVNRIDKENNIYVINAYKTRHFVSATGARGIGKHIVNGQSVGISAQIIGQSLLDANKFYFWYYSDSKEKYFWIFPIGKDLWNVGVWFRKPDNSMKRDFNDCVDRYIKGNFINGYSYKILPKGEFLGNIDQRNIGLDYIDGIGDFAGKNNINNGGGIIYAIQSACEYVIDEHS